jgi:hypothetical protein
MECLVKPQILSTVSVLFNGLTYVPLNLSFSITPNVKATCVILHGFRILYVLRLEGLLEMGMSIIIKCCHKQVSLMCFHVGEWH